MSEEKKVEEKTAQEWFDLGITESDINNKVLYFSKALDIDPNDSYAWYNKGLALLILENYEEAIKCFDKSLEIDPEDADAWHYKGLALDTLSQCAEATACFEKAWGLGMRDRFKKKNENITNKG